MSTWWLVPLALGVMGAVAARLGAERLRRERRATEAASVAVRALLVTVASSRPRH